MKNRRAKLLTCLLLTCVAVLYACGSGHAADAPATVNIAVVIPISGPSADSGRMSKDGAELFKKIINENGGIKSMGGAKVEIEYFDCTSDPAQSKSVMERALSSENFLAVVGCGTSALTLPTLPAIEKSRIPLVSFSNSVDLNNQGYRYVFSVSPTAAAVGAANAEFLDWLRIEKGIVRSKVAIVYENSTWGAPVAEGSFMKCKDMGLEVVYYESFQPNMTDATALVTGMKNAGADIMMVTAYTNDSKMIVDTMNSLNYYPLHLGGSSWQSFADAMGNNVRGVLSGPNTCATTNTVTDNPKYSGLDAIHREMVGYPFSVQGVMCYAALEVITNTLEGTPTTDPIALRDAIAAYDGDSIMQPGHLRFDENGVAVGPVAIICQWQSVTDLVCIWPEEVASGKYIDPADFSKN